MRFQNGILTLHEFSFLVTLKPILEVTLILVIWAVRVRTQELDKDTGAWLWFLLTA